MKGKEKAMKKCIKCNKKFADSVLVCDVCGRYLIADVVSDLNENSNAAQNAPSEARASRVAYDEPSATRANRVAYDETPVTRASRVTYDEPDSTPAAVPVPQFDSYDTDSAGSAGGFRPSTETVGADDGAWRRRPNRGTNYGRPNPIRRFLPVLRVIVPIALLIGGIVMMAANWDVVSEFLRFCLISGMIGGGLMIFIGLRSFHFNADMILIGVLGGIIVGCILRYNILGAATGLGAMISGIMPCIIMVVGIYIMIRGLFR